MIYRIKDETLTDIADQLRLELDTTQTYNPEDMPLAIHLAATQGGEGDLSDFRLIRTIDVPKSSPTTNLMISTDDNGNAFELTSFLVFHRGIKPVDETKKTTLKAWICVNSSTEGYNKGYLGWQSSSYFGYNLQDTYTGSALGLISFGKRIALRADSSTSWVCKSDSEMQNTEKIRNITISGYSQVQWYGHIEIWGK